MHVYDHIIIGGGVIGCSIAYRLAKEGLSVAIFDAGKAGQASMAAGGMLGAQNEFERENPLMEIALESRAMFPHLRDELLSESGIDIELRKAGLLKTAALEGDRDDLHEQFQFLSKKDASIQWLEPEEVPEVEPCMISQTAGAIFLEKDHQVKAPLLAQAFLKAALNAGVHIYEETTVLRLLTRQDRIVGIETPIGPFYTGQVVNAAGAWSSQILAQTGFSLPVIPVKGECLSIRLKDEAPVKTIFAVDGCYMVPKRNKEVLIGATSIADSFDTSVTARGMLSLLQRASHLLPVLNEGTVERTWAGVRPQAADQLPVMGPHPFIEGLHICTGHYRNGILLSPITGILIKEYITGCPEAEKRLTPFAPARFSIKKKTFLG
ncbi:glycine oxidase ThiO [Priestia aryabhattai]|uniref:glycine oxidase ThiO n=1 Tax=Priestia aryabhattai TaxID=412384 RepID=UPI0024534AFE|nr:glycine oxidase ThiO [Priestia aryabhattai]MDH3110989.1 glycine oxidase ThiO [Priestia aryabhattai]MDH3124563.1 glycine oxidase ThiO [Priestia aryabhattai]